MSTHLNEIKSCRYGKMIYNKYDIYIGKSLNLYGEYSESEVSLFRQIISEGMYILDIGANIGAHTLAFSRLAGEYGKVFAFEPQRIIFQMLAGTMAVNSIANVYCYQKAVGEKPGSLIVPPVDYATYGNWGGVELEERGEGEITEVTTVDDMNFPVYNFMKVDVEGMELAVLKGAKKTILKFRPYIYIENNKTDKCWELITYINSLGYDMYWHLAPLFNADNYAKVQGNIFGETVSINMICIPKEFTDVKVNGLEKVEV